MPKTNVITIRVPAVLKERIEKLAKEQGISMNQFAMYALTKEAGELEANDYFKSYLKNKTKKEIMDNFDQAMALVKEAPEPDWDKL